MVLILLTIFYDFPRNALLPISHTLLKRGFQGELHPDAYDFIQKRSLELHSELQTHQKSSPEGLPDADQNVLVIKTVMKCVWSLTSAPYPGARNSGSLSPLG